MFNRLIKWTEEWRDSKITKVIIASTMKYFKTLLKFKIENLPINKWQQMLQFQHFHFVKKFKKKI